MRRFAAVAAVVLAISALASKASFGDTIVYYGSLNTFSSTTDSNVDLDPTTKVYAINVGSTSSVTVNNGSGDLTFSGEWPSGASLDSASNGGNDSGGNPNITGVGAAALKTLLADGRISYSAEYGNRTETPTTINLSVITGKSYDLQLFMAENYLADAGQRGGDISFTNGGNTQQLVDGYSLNGKTGDPTIYHYAFTAASDTVAVIMARSTGFNDNAGMLSALTVSTVPEPSTLVLLGMGLIGLIAYAWRKQK